MIRIAEVEAMNILEADADEQIVRQARKAMDRGALWVWVPGVGPEFDGMVVGLVQKGSPKALIMVWIDKNDFEIFYDRLDSASA